MTGILPGAAALTAALLVGAHYARRSLALNTHPTVNYAAGVVCVCAPLSWAYLAAGTLAGWQAAALLWAFFGLGGVVTVGLYILDHWRELFQDGRDALERERSKSTGEN